MYVHMAIIYGENKVLPASLFLFFFVERFYFDFHNVDELQRSFYNSTDRLIKKSLPAATSLMQEH